MAGQRGQGPWAAYGLALQNPVLVVPHSLASLTGAATLLVAWRHWPEARVGGRADRH